MTEVKKVKEVEVVLNCRQFVKGEERAEGDKVKVKESTAERMKTRKLIK